MQHARTPGHHHTYEQSQVFKGLTIVHCSGCDWWYLQPELGWTLAVAPSSEDSDQPGDEGKRHRGRHHDEESLLRGAESDAREYYWARHSSFKRALPG